MVQQEDTKGSEIQMKTWSVSERNFKKLEKLRPKGKTQNLVIQYLLQLANKNNVTKQIVGDDVCI